MEEKIEVKEKVPKQEESKYALAANEEEKSIKPQKQEVKESPRQQKRRNGEEENAETRGESVKNELEVKDIVEETSPPTVERKIERSGPNVLKKRKSQKETTRTFPNPVEDENRESFTIEGSETEGSTVEELRLERLKDSEMEKFEIDESNLEHYLVKESILGGSAIENSEQESIKEDSGSMAQNQSLDIRENDCLIDVDVSGLMREPRSGDADLLKDHEECITSFDITATETLRHIGSSMAKELDTDTLARKEKMDGRMQSSPSSSKEEQTDGQNLGATIIANDDQFMIGEETPYPNGDSKHEYEKPFIFTQREAKEGDESEEAVILTTSQVYVGPSGFNPSASSSTSFRDPSTPLDLSAVLDRFDEEDNTLGCDACFFPIGGPSMRLRRSSMEPAARMALRGARTELIDGRKEKEKVSSHSSSASSSSSEVGIISTVRRRFRTAFDLSSSSSEEPKTGPRVRSPVEKEEEESGLFPGFSLILRPFTSGSMRDQEIPIRHRNRPKEEEPTSFFNRLFK